MVLIEPLYLMLKMTILHASYCVVFMIDISSCFTKGVVNVYNVMSMYGCQN